jgi:nucleoside-diphosphate-sugar epimerase
MNLHHLNVLVTGGAGMIGSHLIDVLLARGCRVSVIDNLSSGYRDNIPDVPPDHFFPLDIAQEAHLDAVFERRFDVVFHLAANFANKNSVEHPERDLLTNGLGILHILDRCRRFGVQRFVYASSSCVYGNLHERMDETAAAFDPGTPYAMTKLLGEQYTRFYTTFHGLSTVILRYFNCYGPRERPGRYRNVIPNFLYTALNGRPLTITGNGEETRDFCYVSDIVRGTLLAAEQDDLSGEVFNLATGRPTRILDLAERINRLTGNPAGITLQGRRDWDHVIHRHPSIRKAETMLQYTAMTPLEEGLEQTLAWMRARWNDIREQADMA